MTKITSTSTSTEIVSAVKNDFEAIESVWPDIVNQLKNVDKKDQSATINACKVCSALAEEAIIPSQPYLLEALPSVLGVCGDKKSQKETREIAEQTVQTIASKISANALGQILPILFSAIDDSQRWQTRVASLKAIGSFGDHAPEQLGLHLPEVIPAVSNCVVDLKPEVSAAGEKAMAAACDVVGNRDIEHLTPEILRSITHPEETGELMHKLAGVTFVQSVEAPALAMVTPLLVRGLKCGVIAVVRQSSVIIDNMSRLVDDPIDAAPFIPLLLPALEKASSILADPEATIVAERALTTLRRLNEKVEEAKTRAAHIEVAKVEKSITKHLQLKDGINEKYLKHVSGLLCELMALKKLSSAHYWNEIVDYLKVLVKGKELLGLDHLRKECEAMSKPKPSKEEEEDDGIEELCNCTFTLAYGTKILLHNCSLKLKRGAKYGLLGGNDSGKTTLMRSIANGSVEGFPDPSEVRTVFVEADILGELSHLSCVDYIMADERLKGLDKAEVLRVMATVGFTEDGKAKPHHPVSSLSGGWRMKLAMARAMLQRADILLLDEPTNHLDVINVKWVKNYINSLKNVTCIMVSHDSGFLRDCCTHIIQIKNLKLRQYRGNLDAFISENPEAQSYFNIKESKLKFTFPQPGPIEGIKSRSKALMKMSRCYYTYPRNTTPTLHDINIQVSMASRVGCVGENGAGKSTMIKVLTGELVPQQGEVWKHPYARIAYVAQHAFHHIEQHLEKTPNEYIRWRYEFGEDKESLVKVSMVFTEEEEKLQKQPFEITDAESGKKRKVTIAELAGSRRKGKGANDFDYEVRFIGESPTAQGTFLSLKLLTKQGWEKACKAVDNRIAQTAGMMTRPLSSSNVEKHLAEVGLEPEFATHYRMQALSGGQKVKVVLAAALWNQPHILILDEPTNYLDRESLGALARAIEEFQGGVVIISHHNEFVSTICTEEWVMDAGHLTTRGQSGWMDRQDDKIDDQAVIQTMVDATGNTIEVKQKKKLTKREEKALLKKLKGKIEKGEELDSDEEEYALEYNLF